MGAVCIKDANKRLFKITLHALKDKNYYKMDL